MACWYGRGRSFNTSHFKGGFHPPLEPLYSKPGLSALGGCEGGGAPPRRGVARGSFPLRGIQRGACPPLRVQRRESCPPPNPSHARTLRKKGAELAREGDFYFQNNIKFFQGGSGLGCRLGRSWAVPTGHQDPLAPPRAYLVLIRCFILCLLKAGLASPFWGGPAEPGREGFPSGRFPPPAPSRKRNEWGEGRFLVREGENIL